MPDNQTFEAFIACARDAFDRGDYRRSLASTLDALDVPNISIAQRVRALLDQASARRRLGDVSGAMVTTLEAQTIVNESDPLLRGEILMLRANLLVDDGDYRRAAELAGEAATVFVAENRSRATTQALLTAAAALGAAGEPQRAIDALREAIDLALDPDLRSQGLHNLGVLLIDVRRASEAIELLATDAAECQDRGDAYGRGVALYSLGRAHAQLQDQAAAQAVLHKAVTVLRPLGAQREVIAAEALLETLGADR